jgi:hypothetical protein
MNIEEIIEIIREECKEPYPEFSELSEFCVDLLTWERSNISVAVPKYKEYYKRCLEERAKEILSRQGK